MHVQGTLIQVELESPAGGSGAESNLKIYKGS